MRWKNEMGDVAGLNGKKSDSLEASEENEN